MKNQIRKAINKLAYEITGYDICSIEDFKTPEEAIDRHLDWLENHYIDIRQSFEAETSKFRRD